MVKRDLWCGTVLAIIGGVAVLEGRRHRIGSLTRMEAGFFPIMLGVALIALGVLIAALAVRAQSPTEHDPQELSGWPDPRGASAIIAGVLAFLGVGAWFGLAPATFLCVFLSALGDRSSTLRGAFVLAMIMTAIAVGVFAMLLQIQFPIFLWP